jgi:lysine 2,3-aminomutase
MAGAVHNIFKEKLTPYLRGLLDDLQLAGGAESLPYQAMQRQYLRSPLEDAVSEHDRRRHYESDVVVEYEGHRLNGVERLYRRTILIEPTSVCAAHCRWCLRGQYPVFGLTEDELLRFARFCGAPENRDDLREVLITGGDPLMIPKRLSFVIDAIKTHAPNIQIIRVGTRVPVQDPDRIDSNVLQVLANTKPVRLELGTHVNHPAELSPKADEAFRRLSSVVDRIYDQTVLLRGVNDSTEVLGDLYDRLRYLGIEAHYLFHCIPMRGMSHHRTTVQKGLDLARAITSSGLFSGRSKPMYTLMTDIGKVTLYQGAILGRNEQNDILIQTTYTVADFQRRNRSWVQPMSTEVGPDGCLRVWYPDGPHD